MPVSKAKTETKTTAVEPKTTKPATKPKTTKPKAPAKATTAATKKNARPKAKPKTTKPKAETATTKRKKVYAEPGMRILAGKSGMTLDQAKTMVGWEEETKDQKFEEHLFELKVGDAKVKIRCVNNGRNRPFTISLAHTWKQEFLRGKWKLNGETIIIGCFGTILSGQHRLIGFILACLEYANNPDKYPNFNGKFETYVAFGIEEEDTTVNTIDTGKPRTLDHVIYRSEYFQDLKPHHRKIAARATRYAVQLLWKRTGAKDDPDSPRRTHSESIDFIARHERVLQCVRHITTEFQGSSVDAGKMVTIGYASAIMYLMACSASDPDKYGMAEVKDETSLDFSLYNTAEEFWTLFASGAKEMTHLRKALESVGPDDEPLSVDAKITIVLKAWSVVVTGSRVTPKQLELEYHTDEDGVHHIVDSETTGGIDLGDNARYVPPSPSEIQKQLAEERRKKQGGKSADEFAVGDHAWIHDPEGTWDGTVVELFEDDGEAMAKVETSGGDTYECPRDWLHEFEV